MLLLNNKILTMTSEIKDIFSKQTIPSRDLELESKSLDHELELKKEEVNSKKLDNKSNSIDIYLRIFFAFWVLFIVTSFLNYVKEILSLKFNYEKNLSDNVIIALLTTTTINILTLAFMVISYLFPKKFKKKANKN
ncbi:hypothetical protein LBMAG18_08230 [Alphaproteobacteria bacterium]|nr:hypothetical protein LBMAG18_08230 [Alphaproteobacteria bacterium]